MKLFSVQNNKNIRWNSFRLLVCGIYCSSIFHALSFFFSDKIFAVPFVKKCWDVGKFCVGKVGTFVSDFRNVEGNVSILIERKYFILGHIKLIPVFKFSSWIAKKNRVGGFYFFKFLKNIFFTFHILEIITALFLVVNANIITQTNL